MIGSFHDRYNCLKAKYDPLGDDPGFAEGLSELIDEAQRNGATAWELFFAGRLAMHEGRLEEAIGLYNQVVAGSKSTPETQHGLAVAMAMVNKGFTLGELDRADEGIAVYDEVIERFGDASEPALHDPVAAVLFVAPTGVDESYVQGRAVVHNRELVGVDLPSLIEAHNKAAARLVGAGT